MARDFAKKKNLTKKKTKIKFKIENSLFTI